MTMIPAGVIQQQRDHFNLSVEKADRRIELGAEKMNLMSSALNNGVSDAHGPHVAEKRLGRGDIHSNAYMQVLSGSETTATALSGMTYYLWQNPSVMQALTSEIRSSFANIHEITIQLTSILRYLDTVIHEGLCIYPPFAAGSHRIAPKGGGWVDRHFVPEGMHVYAHHYATYHSPAFFALPSKCHPERWLNTDTRFTGDQFDGVRPFGLGPRMCIGQNLAWAEMRLVLCSMLFQFDVKLKPECDDWIDQDVLYV
ncbi:hypothetical protein N0V90_004883 [Kalmusia sp. IMI 367209]|nr:hypothetical protein N0V90_004883 [Kalmusia sp. IMI 367209]